MPSQGIVSVGAVYSALSARLSDGALRRDKSASRSRVATRLLSSTNGSFCPDSHSAYSIETPYLPACTTSVRLALPDQVFTAARCQSVSAASGSGSQARETPCGLRICARVVSSNVRQPVSARKRRQGSAATTAVVSSSRRFMGRGR